MKKLILLLLVLATPAFGAITRVQSKTATSGGSAVASLNLVFDAAPTNGNFIVIAASAQAANVGMSVDSDANITWFGNSKGTNAIVTVLIGQVKTASASATVTINLLSTTNVAVCAVGAEYSGITNILIDRTAASTGTGTAVDTGTTSSTTIGNELLVAGVAVRGSGGPVLSSPTNSFNLIAQASTTVTSVNDKTVGLLDKIVSSTGTANTGVTSGVSGAWAGHIVTIAEAPALSGSFTQTSYIGQ